jgi:protein-tyrosine phosphatase
MASILVVCTGNVCRSPVAEGFLRARLGSRFGPTAPDVASAGVAGWDGDRAHPTSVETAAERGIDIGGHRARTVSTEALEEADLILAMDRGHRKAVGRTARSARERAFTLKELVRLLEALPEAGGDDPVSLLSHRVAEADALRRNGFEGHPHDEDIADPLGMSLQAFRAVAGELDEWCDRLTDGLFGRAPATASVEG